MSENTINIALAADDNYAVCMGITILSVLKSASKEDKLAFYILENQISAKRKAEIESLKKFREFDIFWIPLKPCDLKELVVNQKGLTSTAYARLLIGEKIPCDKIIYLDCDILVRDSLSPLFNVDLGNKWVGGVIDINIASGYYKKNLGERVKHYINSGVLLINCGLWRKYSVTQCLLDYARENSFRLKYNDQDVINYVCAGRKYILSYEWNVMDTFYYPDLRGRIGVRTQAGDIERACISPKIRHYKAFRKNYFGPNKEEYRFLMEGSPWKDFTPQDDSGIKLYMLCLWNYFKVHNFFFFKRKFWQRAKTFGFLPLISNR